MTPLIPWIGGLRAFDPFTADVWDPFEMGGGWLWDTSRRKEGGGGGGGERDDPVALVQFNVDWQETDNTHIIRAELPGVGKGNIKVQVEEGNILTIGGEKVKDEVKSGDTWHRVERRRGSFLRRFKLPENANMDEVKCSLENGELTVVVPKKETASPDRNVRSVDIA